MRKRNILNSSGLLELKKRRQRVLLNKILIFLLGLTAIFISSAYISRLDSLNIKEIEIVGNKIVETEILKAVIEQQITGKYLWIFPKTNILFYPKNTIKSEIQNKFKRLKDIRLSIKDNKILEVSVSERIALYTWCGVKSLEESPEALLVEISTSKASGEECYFLDEDGYVFDEAPYFSGGVYFKFYGSLDTDNPFGSYLSKQNFKQFILFKDVLANMKLKPVALNIINSEDAEVILLKATSSTTEPKIIFKMHADFQKIAENLQAALNTEPLKSKFKNKYGALQYIDLRFGNKVYDKFL